MKCLPILLLLTLGESVHAQAPEFWSWAKSPPMGWNSWDGFATTITEAQTRGQIGAMADKLKRYGWRYIVVDIQWYEPNANGFDYRQGAKLEMDAFGRLQPAPNKFPSAAHDQGFKALADYTHGRGLKFGLHLMRGIPRQAVAAKLPIKGTSFTAADIADKESICPWNGDMYGVDTTKPGAQAYYDSVFQQFAEWGVDFVKVDDLSAPYHQGEVEAIREAIDKTGRRIVLSTSPGPTPLSAGHHIENHANMWRISGDFWDNWPQLLSQFERVKDWTPYRAPGHFPDADMLPIGVIQMGKSKTRFTPDEQITLMTLWSIARSPLMIGADLTKLDDFTTSLITNDEVLRVNQASTNNRELFHRDGSFGWIADVPGSRDKYLALFSAEGTRPVSVDLSELGLSDRVKIRDLWAKHDVGVVEAAFAPTIQSHGAGLYRVSPTHGAQPIDQTSPANGRQPGPRQFGPVVLGPDDKPAFPAAPVGFDKRREGIARGTVETLEYDSKSVGVSRHLLVYTPPGYSPERKYPVLYLLHGIGGTEREWMDNGSPEVILDNLYADGKLKPMIVVFPNGRAQPDDRPEGNIYAAAPAFAKFGGDLLGDIIPFIESRYPTLGGAANRALAGLSMGGGQSLNIGLAHLDTFGWIGGFSSAPNQDSPEALVPNPGRVKRKLKLLWLSCGDKDELIALSQRLHAYLKEKGVPHVWHVDSGPHDFSVWKNDLYLFSQQIFRP